MPAIHAARSAAIDAPPATVSRVEIATAWSVPGPRGWLERLMAPPFLRRVYAAGLAKLAEVAAG